MISDEYEQNLTNHIVSDYEFAKRVVEMVRLAFPSLIEMPPSPPPSPWTPPLTRQHSIVY